MSEETIAIAPTSAEKTSNQDMKPRRLSVRRFDFLWWRDSRREDVLKKENNQRKQEELIEVNVIDCQSPPTNKRSFNFFKDITKLMRLRKLTTQDSNQKTTEPVNLQNDTNYDSSVLQRNNCTVSENTVSEDTIKNSDALSNNETIITSDTSENESSLENQNEELENCSDTERKSEVLSTPVVDNFQTDNNYEIIPSMHQMCPNNRTLQSRSDTTDNIVEEQSVEEILESDINNDKAKASITTELLKLSSCGWYWGPISGTEADAKLISEPDGAFLVRDSSDDRYVLTLSFKSSGKLFHTRMEHSGGLFSLCNQSGSKGFSSVADLINYSMNFSQTAVVCYSRPKYPGHPSFPVRLTKPVSRFNQVRSLQYLCRFVIRQNTRLDNIQKLPLPNTIKGYIEQAHY